jgi:hypothetical protein
MAVRSGVGIVRFKLIADTGEVRVYRLRFDVVAHIYSVETEGIGGWVNRKLVGSAEGDV